MQPPATPTGLQHIALLARTLEPTNQFYRDLVASSSSTNRSMSPPRPMPRRASKDPDGQASEWMVPASKRSTASPSGTGEAGR